MKILLNILLAAGFTGLVFSLGDQHLNAVGIFNFTFVTALVAWTLAQYEPRKRPAWMPKRADAINAGYLRTHRWVRTTVGKMATRGSRSATSV